MSYESAVFPRIPGKRTMGLNLVQTLSHRFGLGHSKATYTKYEAHYTVTQFSHIIKTLKKWLKNSQVLS